MLDQVPALEHGDLRLPYVLGALWNGKDKPPAGNDDGANNLRQITSRSGHVIKLNDEDGKETIEIVDKSGANSIVIDTAEDADIPCLDLDGYLADDKKYDLGSKTVAKLVDELTAELEVERWAHFGKCREPGVVDPSAVADPSVGVAEAEDIVGVHEAEHAREVHH